MLNELKNRFEYSQLQLIDREAPDQLRVPSGSHVRLTYEEGRPRYWRCEFRRSSLKETPRVAGGRVRVLIAPAGSQHAAGSR